MRGWIRAARRSAAQLRTEAIRTIVKLDQDAFTIRVLPGELAGALEHLGTAAMLMARHIKLENVHSVGDGQRLHPRPAADRGPGRLSRNRRSGPPPARRRPNPPRICPSARHLAHPARHHHHQTARNARFFIGVVNAAYIGIFSAGQHRFRFLLGATDGEGVFTPDEP